MTGPMSRVTGNRMTAEEIINIVLLTMLALTAIGIARLRNLFAVTMLAGIYSLLSASIFVVLDAVDVAFTEAAVGAGITTVLLLGTLMLTSREERPGSRRNRFSALVVVFAFGAVLVYATLDPMMPHFGDPSTPAQVHVAPQYLQDWVRQGGSDEPVHVGIPNIVTTVLASYRGYDTLGETVVIFTAGIAVLLLLGQRRRRRRGQTPEMGAKTGPKPGGED
jgi:multicomponent Na+:H+ antiporter subunit B